MAGGYRSRFVPYVGGVSGASAFVPQAGGRRALFGWWFGGFAGTATSPPPPPPAASTPSGGWEYDPFRRRRRRDDDDEPAVPPPPAPVEPPGRPLVDLGEVRARIAALERDVAQAKQSGEAIAEYGRQLQIARALQQREEQRRRILAADDEWFMIH